MKKEAKALINKSAKVINAQYRNSVGRVVVTLDNGDILFVHPKVINNIIGLKLDPISVRKLIGGEAHYEAVDVSRGETFKWNNNTTDVQVADDDLRIRNLNAVIVTPVNDDWLLANCEPAESSASWDEQIGNSDEGGSDDDTPPVGATEEPEDNAGDSGEEADKATKPKAKAEGKTK